jgi:fatty-acyl-CoA synthase
MTTVAAFLTDLEARHGARAALVTADKTISFAQFAARVRRVTDGLAALGIGAGDRVVIWLPNVPAWLEVACACANLGAIAVACNTRFRSAEVGDILFRSRASTLVLWPDFKHIPFLGILSEVPAEQLVHLDTIVLYGPDDPPEVRAITTFDSRRVVAYDSLASAPARARCQEPSGTTGFLCFLTSGTTSRPKFALHSQAGVVEHAYNVAEAFGYDQPDARVLTMNPLCGVLGFNQAFAALAAGAPQVLPTYFEGGAMAELIPEEKITHAVGIDEAFTRIFDRVSARRPFPTLRSIGSGSYNGDFESFVRMADDRDITAVGIYGMSEIGAMFSCQRHDSHITKRATAGGFPVNAAARVRARDPETGTLMPFDEMGELEFAGPSRMLGYLDDPASTARCITEDGFVRSGDIGCIHADGSFSFMSRMGDALRLSGFLVSPLEIAGVLEEHVAVERCQVVGCMNEGTLRPVAFVIASHTEPLDEAALITWCKKRLAPFKAPVRVLPLDAFPVSVGPNGEKVQHAKLREMAAAALA